MTPRLGSLGGVGLLLAILRDPARLISATESEWDVLLSAAERTRLWGRLAFEAQRMGVVASAPPWVRDRIASSNVRGREFERLVRWELDRVQRALAPVDVRAVFLKGAAYVAAGLPFASGRVVSDVDVLVPEADLPRVETALKAQGWAFVDQSAYDARYYREWMHELPPMRHQRRKTTIDVHHAILPRTSRLHPDSRLLLQRTVRVGGAHVLCPTHMVAHAAAHLFHDGEVSGAIRDVVDVDGLLRAFATAEADFWPALVRDTRELGLLRPTFYAVRYANRLLGTQVPSDLWRDAPGVAPSSPILSLMDALVERTLRGAERGSLPVLALYVRSHWLRMPPLMLVRHLLHQATAR